MLYIQIFRYCDSLMNASVCIQQTQKFPSENIITKLERRYTMQKVSYIPAHTFVVYLILDTKINKKQNI